MAEQTNNIVNNPFAALFPTLTQAQQFQATSVGTEKDLPLEEAIIPQQSTEAALTLEDEGEEDVKDIAVRTLNTNKIIEQIFLITLDKEKCPLDDRPPRCVLMENLAETLGAQNWLDMESLEQAVFERLLMESPGSSVITTWTSHVPDVRSASLAGESQVLRYLYQCYTRWKTAHSEARFQKYSEELEKCHEVILLNAKTCLQQSDLYSNQSVHGQFIDIYLLESGNRQMLEFFDKVVVEIDNSQEDGTVLQVFKPVLDIVSQKFTKDSSMMSPDVSRYMELLRFFTRHVTTAEAFLEYNAPAEWKNGRSYSQTLIGSILSLTCIPRHENGPYEFFNSPSSATKQEHDITESNIWRPLAAIGDGVYQLLFSIIKLSPDLRHRVMTWLGKCVEANFGRSKIWSSQMPQVFNQMYASEGFSLNLCRVMLHLCKPFSEPCSPKLLKIQPSYTSVIVSDDEHAKTAGVHSAGLQKETCLIPAEENERLPPESSYSFITECFFMTHQCLYMGFHTVHEKFLKLNQDLHRIQRMYLDVREQAGNDDVEPVRSIKQQMEKGMTLFLSIKAALTEPELLEMCLSFHLGTSTWLCQCAARDGPTEFAQIKLPLPELVPKALAHIPEFIIGNISDYTLFLQRFKDEMYELAGEKLEHFMTLILVFMGSLDRMRNPHLRAELAETLAGLMPGKDPGNSRGILSKFHREQLFMRHPLIVNLAEKLLHVFVSIEMTGQSVAFEQKFNYRRPMYMVLEYIWEMQLHKDAIKVLAADAERNIEASDPPLFLRFINLLINDAIFLLDEALSYMSQIKEKQQEKDRGGWDALTQQQRQETEMNFRHMGMLARYHNVMGNYTIHSLELISQEIKTIFCQSAMVERIAGMLNYFLLHLVGPKQKTFNVKDKNEYEFKPQQLVSDIIQIYLNLEESEDFCMAVCSDGRSYSPELFPKALEILQRIGRPPQMISSFLKLEQKIKGLGQRQKEEEELFADAPDEFLDPIMGTLMKDPVILPASKNIVDRAVIARHILSDQTDPFNRSPLSMDMVIPHTELQQKIHKWIQESRMKSKD